MTLINWTHEFSSQIWPSSNVSHLSEWHSTPPVTWDRSRESMNPSSPSSISLSPPYMIHHQVLSVLPLNISQFHCLLTSSTNPLFHSLSPGCCNSLFTDLHAYTSVPPQSALYGSCFKITFSFPSNLNSSWFSICCTWMKIKHNFKNFAWSDTFYAQVDLTSCRLLLSLLDSCWTSFHFSYVTRFSPTMPTAHALLYARETSLSSLYSINSTVRPSATQKKRSLFNSPD